MNLNQDTIIAPITAPGIGAVSVIRISGSQSFPIVNALFPTKDLSAMKSHTLHYGNMVKGEKIIDEVVISTFKGPNSYTKEDVLEIACHGSPYIVKTLLMELIAAGARMAKPGEFTTRAFLNGRFDLSQAEAVADLINSETEASHTIALQQLRGGVSSEIKKLREELIHFASMIELELDFSEEDVEFANREELKVLVAKIEEVVISLIDSFEYGNAMKEGIPIVIAGRPNAGKSTLLNALLKEDKAIVSSIPGTTRDVIEDVFVLDGVKFRLIDTAGLRSTDDTIENIGVERAYAKIKGASLVLYLVDMTNGLEQEELEEISDLGANILLVQNKIDALHADQSEIETELDHISISAKEGINLEALKQKIINETAKAKPASDVIISSLRHLEILKNLKEDLIRVLEGLNEGVSNDFTAMDIRSALNHLGEITGEISTDDLLDNIFSKFCIGK